MKTLSRLSLIAGLALLPAIAGSVAEASSRSPAPLDDPPVSWHGMAPKRHRAAARLLATGLKPLPRPTTNFSAAMPSLHETGRVGSPGLGGALNAVREVAIEARGERILALATAAASEPPVQQRIVGEEVAALHGDSVASAFKQCRIEVARRRQVPLGEVGAGAVQLRWTVQPTGEVRNAEAIATESTDLTVAACMKRVVAMRSFGPQLGAITVERTYTYRF